MAHIAEPRVRETSTTTGTNDLVLAGAMRGSLRFSEVMSPGDTCDYVVHYDTCFEEGLGTLAPGGELQRTTVYRVRHADGTVDATKISLPAGGVKTVIMTVRASKIGRVDVVQSFTQTERNRLCANLGLPQSGDKVICPQASAWIGWTKDTTHHDKAIRLVTDASGGSSGGSLDFSVVHGRTATDSRTLTQANLPAVNWPSSGGSAYLKVDVLIQSGSTQGGTGIGGDQRPSSNTYGTTQGGLQTTFVAPTVSSGGSSTPFTMPIDLRVKHVNCIICTKD